MNAIELIASEAKRQAKAGGSDGSLETDPIRNMVKIAASIAVQIDQMLLRKREQAFQNCRSQFLAVAPANEDVRTAAIAHPSSDNPLAYDQDFNPWELQLAAPKSINLVEALFPESKEEFEGLT